MAAASFIISILAFIVAFWGTMYGLRYSKINIFHTTQQLILSKAKECNVLYYKAWRHPEYHGPGAILEYNYLSTISELIVSIQLLDNSLKKFKQKRDREFFLGQFWTQLDTSLRTWLINLNYARFPETAIDQIKTLQTIFSKFK